MHHRIGFPRGLYAIAAVAAVLLACGDSRTGEPTKTPDLAATPTLASSPTAQATQQPSATPQQPVTRVEGLLLTANRDRLAICVQDESAAADVVSAQAMIRDVLTELEQHPLWAPAGLALLPEPAVDAGCGVQPLLLRPGVRYNGKDVEGENVRFTTPPGVYRVMMFVLAPEPLASISGAADPIRVAEEMWCEGHSCAEATTGVYATREDLQDRQCVKEMLTSAIGLAPSTDAHRCDP